MSLSEEWTASLGDLGADCTKTCGLHTQIDSQAVTEALVSGSSDAADTAATRPLTAVIDRGDGTGVIRTLGSIGRGGMGEVLLAQQLSLDRPVALKTLSDGFTKEAAAAFRAEVRATASLEHPVVVPMHDAGSDYMLMKAIEGRTLAELLADADVPVPDLVEVVQRLSECVAYAHQQGLVHRDIKPANVMVGRHGEVYLLDWGIALALQDGPAGIPRIDQANNLCAGTPAYLAPETARGDRDRIGPGVDVFGLGALVYEIVARHAPLAGKDMRSVLTAAAAGRYQEVSSEHAEAEPELLAIALKAMAYDPEQRGSAQELTRQLADWQGGAIRRREARQRLEEARTALRDGCAATEPSVGIPLLERSIVNASAAAALAPGSEAADTIAAEARRELARLALAGGDLVLAGEVLDRDQDPRLDQQRSDLARRRQRLAREKRTTRLAARLAWTALGLVSLTALGYAGLVGTDDMRRDRARAHEARDILTEIRVEPDAGVAIRNRAAAQFEKALAIHPQPTTLHPALLAHLRKDITWGLAAERPGFVRDRLERAQAYGMPADEVAGVLGGPDQANTVRWLEHADERRQQRTLARRRQRLDEIIETGRIAPSPNPWLELAANELTRWSWQDDEDQLQAGTEALIVSLHAHPEPRARQLAAELVKLHHTGDVGVLANCIDRLPIETLLGDSDPAVQMTAAWAMYQRNTTDDFFRIAWTGMNEGIDPSDVLAASDSVWFWNHFNRELKRADAVVDKQLREAGIKRVLVLAKLRGLREIAGRARSMLGESSSREGDAAHDAMEKAWQRRDLAALRPLALALIEDHQCIEAYCNLAERLLDDRHWSEARDLLQPVAELPGYDRVLPYYALALAELGQKKEADRCFELAVGYFNKGYRHNYYYLTAMLNASEELRRYDDAIRIADALVQQNPGDKWSLGRRALTYLASGDPEQALSHAREVRERWPKFHLAYQVSSRALMRLERYDEAVVMAEAAVSRRRRDGDLYGDLAKALIKQGQRDRALTAFIAGSEARWPSGSCLSWGLQLSLQLGRPGSALRLALGARKRRPAGELEAIVITRLLLGQGYADLALDQAEDYLRRIDDPAQGRGLVENLAQAAGDLRLRGWRGLDPSTQRYLIAAEAMGLLLGIQKPAGQAADVDALLDAFSSLADEAGADGKVARQGAVLLYALRGDAVDWQSAATSIVDANLSRGNWTRQLAENMLRNQGIEGPWTFHYTFYLDHPTPTDLFTAADRDRLIALAETYLPGDSNRDDSRQSAAELLRGVPIVTRESRPNLDQALAELQASEQPLPEATW